MHRAQTRLGNSPEGADPSDLYTNESWHEMPFADKVSFGILRNQGSKNSKFFYRSFIDFFSESFYKIMLAIGLLPIKKLHIIWLNIELDIEILVAVYYTQRQL